MSGDGEELFELAVTLPASERAALVIRLLDSIATPGAAATGQHAESLDRLDAARAGALERLDDDDAMRLLGLNSQANG